MNARQVNATLKRCSIYRGVYALDELVKLKKPFAVVVNTDTSDEPGEHWVAIYAPRRGRCEYFDPMGYPPANRYLVRYLNSLSTKFIYCCHALQGVGSNKCGQYCVAYIRARARRKAYQTFVNMFTWDFIDNDRRLLAMNK